MECEQVNDIRNIYIRDYTLCTNFGPFLDLMITSNTYKLKQLSQFLFYALPIKKKVDIKLLAQMHTNRNALHYGPMAPLQINLLT